MKAKLNGHTIRKNAASCLGNYYWNGFGAALLLSIMISIVNYIASNVTTIITALFGIETTTTTTETINDYLNYYTQTESTAYLADWRVELISFAVSIVFAVFVTWMLSTGGCAYFLRSRYYPGTTQMSHLFYPFKKYASAVRYAIAYYWRLALPYVIGIPVMVGGAVLITYEGTELLGAMMVIVAAIVMSVFGIIIELRLYCVPYIFAENPDIAPKRAIELSNLMTDGYKGKLFWLEIVNALMLLAGVCCCLVGVLFISPYVYAIEAEIYTFLSEVAKQSGKLDSSELGATAEIQEETINEA